MVVAGNMIITKKQLADLLSEWGRQFVVLTPSRAGNSSSMSPWNGQNISFLDWYRNTNIPVKNCFLPDMEELFCFNNIIDLISSCAMIKRREKDNSS